MLDLLDCCTETQILDTFLSFLSTLNTDQMCYCRNTQVYFYSVVLVHFTVWYQRKYFYWGFMSSALTFTGVTFISIFACNIIFINTCF